MREEIECNIKIYDNCIEITPIEGVLDNSFYEIEIESLFPEFEDEVINDIYIGFNSRMYPYYTSSYAVNALVGQYEIPEDVILFHIREASRYVDYMLKRIDTTFMDPEDINFKASQFVKYSAAYDCVLRLFVDKAAMAGIKGELADVKFDNNGGTKDLDKLLKELKAGKTLWEDNLKGYEDIGRASPIGTVRGIRAIPEVNPVPVNWMRGQYNSRRNHIPPYRSLPRGGYTGPMGNAKSKEKTRSKGKVGL